SRGIISRVLNGGQPITCSLRLLGLLGHSRISLTLDAGYSLMWGPGLSPRPHMASVSASRDDARDDAGADRLVALANGEARLLLDRDRLHQLAHQVAARAPRRTPRALP